MPHLSELAKKYGDQVSVIGVDIWEDQHAEPGVNLKKKVDAFVAEMGERMNYSVCADTLDTYMTKEWMQAAGQGGIPATFVVGKTSKIEWIGHPISLDEPLSKILDGTFDTKSFAAKMNPDIDQSRKQTDQWSAINKPIDDAVKAKNYKLAISECDKALSTAELMHKPGLAMTKFQLVVKHMASRAYSEALKIKSDPEQSWMASEVFATTPGLDRRCYMFALDFFKKKYEPQPSNPMGNAHYSDVYYQLGEYSKAVEKYQLFVDAMKKAQIDPVTMKGFEEQLEKLKKAAVSKKSSR